MRTPPPPIIPIPAPIVIQETSSGGGGKRILFGVLGLLVLAIVVVTVWSMVGGDKEQVYNDPPTPSASASVSPREKTLASYFGLPKATATISGNDTAATDFRNSLLTAEPAAKQGLVMEVMQSGSRMSPNAFLNATIANVPAALTGSFGTDWMALAYGQNESFDGLGQSIANAAIVPTLALIIEVTDASKVNQTMQAWEGTELDESASKLFGYIRENAIVTGFTSGTYRQIALRFRNFPYADQSLDWALALGSNGKNYLILTGSRESAFFVIDQINQ